ncbi:MAG: patatin-like phospholipase family protein [Gammaproteobacteria bacterium]
MRVEKYAKRVDRFFNDNHYLKGRRSPWMKALLPCGHSWKIMVISGMVLAFTAYGPTGGIVPGHSWTSFVLLVTGVLLLFLGNGILQTDRGHFWLHILVIALVAAIVWFWADPLARVGDNRPYQHIFIPWIGLLIVGLLVAKLLTIRLFKRYDGKLHVYDQPISLPPRPRDQDLGIDGWRLLRSFVKVPFYHGVEILWLPAFVLILFANPVWAYLIAFLGLLLMWAVYAFADMHEDLEQLLGLLRRALFTGGAFIVSLAVIALGMARVFNIHYINTLVESTGQVLGVSWIGNYTLQLYILTAYAGFWFYEYWVNRILGESIIRSLRKPDTPDTYAGIMEWDIRQLAYPGSGGIQTAYVALHGGSRFSLLDKKDGRIRQRYGRMALLKQLINPEKRAEIEGYGNRSGRQRRLVIKHRIHSYFAIQNIILGGLVIISVAGIRDLPEKAEASIYTDQNGEYPALIRLQESIFGEHAPDAPILLAASGGGTRAALYTESVLAGLRQMDVLDDVVVVSGVSGGSVALAYFAAHYKDLTSDEPAVPDEAKDSEGGNAWELFSDTMSSPFILDVLEGVAEWRIAGWQNDAGHFYGVRLGELLAESIERRICLTPDETGSRICDLGKNESSTREDQRRLGLIFNTTISGRFYAEEAGTAGCHENGNPLPVQDDRCEEYRDAYGRGHRLILTNMELPDKPSALDAPEAPHIFLIHKVVDARSLTLGRAAALSSNFPPVFPDTAVDINGDVRYWVTDGGASENRGLVSLLYALKEAIDNQSKKPVPEKISSSKKKAPVIHIVVADASAMSPSYSQVSRGLGAVFGASMPYANQLIDELVDDIRKLYKEKLDGQVSLHYLYMPTILRSDGGLQTHWMLSHNVTLRRPLDLAASNNDSCETTLWDSIKKMFCDCPPDKCVTDGGALRKLIRGLHRVDYERPAGEGAADAGNDRLPYGADGEFNAPWRWICQDPYASHARPWVELVNEFQPGATTYNDYCDSLLVAAPGVGE